MVFALLSQVIGFGMDTSDFPGVNTWMQFVLRIFRNSIGDIQPPKYDFWTNSKENYPFVSEVMITLVWFLWFCNMFLNMIILLNFLIVVISQSYDKVLLKAQSLSYASKCDFIGEADAGGEAVLGPLNDKSNVYILQCIEDSK